MNLHKRTGPCSEDLFWDCVEEIGWPCNIDRAKLAALHAWDIEFGRGFEVVFREKRRRVMEAFEAYERELSQDERGSYYLSDDGMSDFTAHVVGLGRAVFEREILSPKLLIQRAQKRDYEENFGYCIPYTPTTTASFEKWCKVMGYELSEDEFERNRRFGDERAFEEYLDNIREAHARDCEGDWRSLNPRSYAIRARQFHASISAFLAQLQSPSNDAETDAVEAACVCAKYLAHLMDEETDEALLLSEDAMRSWWMLYHIARERRELRQKDADFLPMVHPHGMENLINDHRMYMGELDKFSCMFHLRQLQEDVA